MTAKTVRISLVVGTLALLILILAADNVRLNKETAIPDAVISPVLSESEARGIAQQMCIKGGEAVAPGTYNENSKTWWFDANLNATRPGCSPACVVSEESKTAEINWRCTGLITPEEERIPEPM